MKRASYQRGLSVVLKKAFWSRRLTTLGVSASLFFLRTDRAAALRQSNECTVFGVNKGGTVEHICPAP